MAKFRKKPIVIEAVQWLNKQIIDGPSWFEKAELNKTIRLCGHDLLIQTMEGEMIAKPGDWIICGVKGEIYPCKPDIFEATYESVADEISSVVPALEGRRCDRCGSLMYHSRLAGYKCSRGC